MKNKPKISVLMPVYNCAEYIDDAISSILSQSFTDFEFLIIDDASNDETVSIIKSYDDKRICLVEKPKNTGYTNSLNYGLSIAKGDYIARMDGDDISLPDRFKKQIEYMDAHLNVIACGTTYKLLDSEIVKNVPIKHEDIKIQLLQKTCFGHPTIMLRKSIIDQYNIRYDSTKEPAEDYDLWVRLLAYGDFYNLPDVLLKYRLHDAQVTVNKVKQKFHNYFIIKRNILNYLDASLTTEENNVLDRIIYRKVLKYKEVKIFRSIKQKFLDSNKKGVFKTIEFNKYMKEMEFLLLKDYFFYRKSYFPVVFKHYLDFNKTFDFKISAKERFKLFIKSIFFYKKS